MNVLSNLINEHKLDCKIRTSVRILKELDSNGVVVKIYLNDKEIDSDSSLTLVESSHKTIDTE